MVALSTVSSSNRLIASKYPNGTVAVFVGATSGIGYYTLKQFAKHTSGTKAKVYFVGRNKEAGVRITGECSKLNPNGEFIFMQGDVSLLKKTDEVCAAIKEKEQRINLLFLSAGTLAMNVQTSEGLDLAMAITYYSRTRFIANLLPQLQNATAASELARVVTVLAGTKEGKFYEDISGETVPFISRRGHLCSLITLSLSHLASQAPGVSFVHSYPGPVKTGIDRDMKGPLMTVLKGLFIVAAPLICIPSEESGDRHLFLATSGMFGADGVVVDDGKDILAKGVMDGVKGSRVYSTTSACEPAKPKTIKLMEGMKKNGKEEKAWEHTTEVFKRVTGIDSL